MHKFVFQGRVFPELEPLKLGHRPKFSISDAETAPDATFEAAIENGELTVTAEVITFDSETADSLFFFAYDLARTLCEIATLQTGIHYTAVIDSVIDPQGVMRHLLLADRSLAGLMTIFETIKPERLIEEIVGDIRLARAVSDLSVMLSWPHYAPIAAGRVADSITRLITGGRSPADWQATREALRVDKPFVMMLTDHGAPPRHGDRQYVSGATNKELARRAWMLMDRYLTLRLAGGSSLDPALYPELTG